MKSRSTKIGVTVIFLAATFFLFTRHAASSSYLNECFRKPPKVSHTFDCRPLFSSSTHSMYFYRMKRASHPKVSSFPTQCSDFIRARGYPLHVGSLEEASFPIAYSIAVYKDFQQVEMLLRAIYQPQNYYCLHVDLKSNAKFRARLNKLAECLPNVFMSSESYDVRWGRMSVLAADLICMKDLLTRFKSWKCWINLTGQEFPLKTNLEMVRILTSLNATNNVHSDTRE
jgi:hypothetical protein